MGKPVDLAEAQALAKNAAKAAHAADPGVEFTEVLGTGAFGTVLGARVLRTANDIVASDCGKSVYGTADGVRTGKDRDIAIKVQREGKVVGEREYELMRWAIMQGFGIPVYCEATWEIQRPGRKSTTYHLIFMKSMDTDLNTLSESEKTPDTTKAYAWALACNQVTLASIASPPSIVIDLKPENIMVGWTKNDHISEVHLSDMDAKMWKSVPTSDEALFFNFLSLVSNTIFPIDATPGLESYWPAALQTFAHDLLGRWRTTQQFKEYLTKWGKGFQDGIFHYAIKKSKKGGASQSISSQVTSYLSELQAASKHYRFPEVASPTKEQLAETPGAWASVRIGNHSFLR